MIRVGVAQLAACAVFGQVVSPHAPTQFTLLIPELTKAAFAAGGAIEVGHGRVRRLEVRIDPAHAKWVQPHKVNVVVNKEPASPENRRTPDGGMLATVEAPGGLLAGSGETLVEAFVSGAGHPKSSWILSRSDSGIIREVAIHRDAGLDLVVDPKGPIPIWEGQRSAQLELAISVRPARDLVAVEVAGSEVKLDRTLPIFKFKHGLVVDLHTSEIVVQARDRHSNRTRLVIPVVAQGRAADSK